jgi:hypothetical protein
VAFGSQTVRTLGVAAAVFAGGFALAFAIGFFALWR